MGLLTDIIREHVEEKHADEDRRKSELRQMYHGIAFNPDPAISDSQREDARANYAKLLNPDAKKSMQKGGDLFDQVRAAAGQQQPNAGDGPAASSGPAPGQDTVNLAAPAGGGAMTVQNRLPMPQTALPGSTAT